MNVQLDSVNRIYIVWDGYNPDSIKAASREKQSKGIRRNVSGETKLTGKHSYKMLKTRQNNLNSCQVAAQLFNPSKAVYIMCGDL